MSKLIIDNQSRMPMDYVMPLCERVIENGRISGTGDKAQYCYHTVFSTVSVSAFKNKHSDRLVIMDLSE